MSARLDPWARDNLIAKPPSPPSFRDLDYAASMKRIYLLGRLRGHDDSFWTGIGLFAVGLMLGGPVWYLLQSLAR